MINFLAFVSVKVIPYGRKQSGIVESNLEDISLVPGRNGTVYITLGEGRNSLDTSVISWNLATI